MNSIVITTINPETPAIAKFKNMKDWRLILVGDLKTPEYDDPNIDFISAKATNTAPLNFSHFLPNNSYCRKNLGYLQAIRGGSKIIYETDDDNIPYEDIKLSDDFFSCKKILTSSNKFANIYKFLSGKHIWNRGFPIELINENIQYTLSNWDGLNVGVWQTLIDHDPDVDAIYRLTNNSSINFNVPSPFVLENHKYAPFNSQSTFWSKDCFLYMYFPTTVSWRFADILRGYIAQRLMRQDNLHLGFSKSLVFQDRFRNDYMKDFVDEIPMYTNVVKTIDILDNVKLGDNKANNLKTIYKALYDNGIVENTEFCAVDFWITSVESALKYV